MRDAKVSASEHFWEVAVGLVRVGYKKTTCGDICSRCNANSAPPTNSNFESSAMKARLSS